MLDIQTITGMVCSQRLDRLGRMAIINVWVEISQMNTVSQSDNFQQNRDNQQMNNRMRRPVQQGNRQ